MNREPDISPTQLEILRALLALHLPKTSVWLYGSRVKGSAKSSSDLDMVVFSKPEQRRQISELREAFEESPLPFRVDLFIWDDLPDSFRENIQREHLALVDSI